MPGSTRAKSTWFGHEPGLALRRTHRSCAASTPLTLPPEGREFRHRDRAALAGEATVLADGPMRWITATDGAVVATLTAKPRR